MYQRYKKLNLDILKVAPSIDLWSNFSNDCGIMNYLLAMRIYDLINIDCIQLKI
jgi:hypothetical protein